jgi:hypothetical protein
MEKIMSRVSGNKEHSSVPNIIRALNQAFLVIGLDDESGGIFLQERDGTLFTQEQLSDLTEAAEVFYKFHGSEVDKFNSIINEEAKK